MPGTRLDARGHICICVQHQGQHLVHRRCSMVWIINSPVKKAWYCYCFPNELAEAPRSWLLPGHTGSMRYSQVQNPGLSGCRILLLCCASSGLGLLREQPRGQRSLLYSFPACVFLSLAIPRQGAAFFYSSSLHVYSAWTSYAPNASYLPP